MGSAEGHELRGEATADSVEALRAELLRAHREAHQLHRELASLRERAAMEREDREDLLAVINDGLGSIKSNGQYQEIVNRHMESIWAKF